LEFWEREDGEERARRKRVSLGHRNRERAQREARGVAARLAAGPVLGTEEITLGSLFDIYRAEVTPRKSAGVQLHDRAAAELFLELWRRDRRVSTLTLREWEQFIDARRDGRIGGRGLVGNRQIGYDLSWLRAVFNWATKAGINGEPLLLRNPFHGFPIPRERSPQRPVITEEQYQALLSAAETINWRLALAMVLANETGHRLSAIRRLRWSDMTCSEAGSDGARRTTKSGTNTSRRCRRWCIGRSQPHDSELRRSAMHGSCRAAAIPSERAQKARWTNGSRKRHAELGLSCLAELDGMACGGSLRRNSRTCRCEICVTWEAGKIRRRC
jgi:integrase